MKTLKPLTISRKDYSKLIDDILQGYPRKKNTVDNPRTKNKAGNTADLEADLSVNSVAEIPLIYAK